MTHVDGIKAYFGNNQERLVKEWASSEFLDKFVKDLFTDSHVLFPDYVVDSYCLEAGHTFDKDSRQEMLLGMIQKSDLLSNVSFYPKFEHSDAYALAVKVDLFIAFARTAQAGHLWDGELLFKNGHVKFDIPFDKKGRVIIEHGYVSHPWDLNVFRQNLSGQLGVYYQLYRNTKKFPKIDIQQSRLVSEVARDPQDGSPVRVLGSDIEAFLQNQELTLDRLEKSLDQNNCFRYITRSCVADPFIWTVGYCLAHEIPIQKIDEIFTTHSSYIDMLQTTEGYMYLQDRFGIYNPEDLITLEQTHCYLKMLSLTKAATRPD